MGIGQVKNFLCEKINISNPSNFALAPLKGTPLSENETFAAYGLGSLFESWQVRLVPKGSLFRSKILTFI